jgi:diguanylate cyclase (GGDEF)-like protein
MTLLLFALPPALGAVIQNYRYGVSLIWVCVTISILIIFLGIQNDKLYRDYLTGLYNRRQLDNFLMTKSKTDGKMIGGLMIDINDFKSINDRFGHKSGDEALQSTAKILTDTFGKDIFISRYGGDEFVVIIETHDEHELEEAVIRLSKNIEMFNNESHAKYELSFSIGYDCCPVDDLSSFIEHIDSLMYTHKQNTKPEKPLKMEGESI